MAHGFDRSGVSEAAAANQMPFRAHYWFKLFIEEPKFALRISRDEVPTLRVKLDFARIAVAHHELAIDEARQEREFERLARAPGEIFTLRDGAIELLRRALSDVCGTFGVLSKPILRAYRFDKRISVSLRHCGRTPSSVRWPHFREPFDCSAAVKRTVIYDQIIDFVGLGKATMLPYVINLPNWKAIFTVERANVLRKGIVNHD